MSDELMASLRQYRRHFAAAARSLSYYSSLPLILLAAIFFLLTGCGDKTVDAQPAPPRPVRYLSIRTAQPAPAASWTGEIRAHDEIALSFRLDGKMVARSVDVGDRVHAGQQLAAIESTIGKNQLDSALSDLEGAKASAQAAALNLSRMRKLMPSGAIARSQLDSARADWLTADARLKSSAAAARSARENLAWTRLSAPSDGAITRVSASPGQVVGAGQTVMTLAAGDSRDVAFDVSDPEQLAGQKEAPFRVSLLTTPAVYAQGKLRDISPQADPQTRTWRVRVTLQAPPAGMALGASVMVELPPAAARGYAVPASALSREGERPAVFIIDSQMQVQPRIVTLAGYTASSAVISSGLRPGDKVIIAGVSKLRAGEKVSAGEPQS